MTPDDLEVLQAIRVVLGVGFFFVFAVLLADNLPTPRAAARVQPIKPDEECKLHARKLSECNRLGYHRDDKGENDDDGGDSAG